MKFVCAKTAIKWAEETASRPDMQSQIGALMNARGGVSGKTTPLEVALSITTMISGCTPPVPAALRCIYGLTSKQKEIELAEVMAERIKITHGKYFKPIDQLTGLCIATIKQKRKRELFDKKFPIRKMAKITGVSRHQFCTAVQWISLRGQAKSMLDTFVDQGVSEIDRWLLEVDWVY